jgi:hypothetical protein
VLNVECFRLSAILLAFEEERYAPRSKLLHGDLPLLQMQYPPVGCLAKYSFQLLTRTSFFCMAARKLEKYLTRQFEQNVLPTWKSATQQVWKPALRRQS